jgi:hypothetical protein
MAWQIETPIADNRWRDRDNPLLLRDGVTSAEIRAELIAMMMQARDNGEVLELPAPIEGVANRE